MTAPVQTRCACGHSLAAHERGPCQGIDVFGRHRQQSGSIDLCECPEIRHSVAIPAAGPTRVSRR